MDLLNTFLTTLLVQLMPVLLQVVAVVVALLIGLAARAAWQWFGIEIEARHREALHSAIMTGIKSAVAAGFGKDKAMEVAVGYARQSVPDAMRRLKPVPEVLMDIAHAKLDDVLSTRAEKSSDGS